MHPTRLVIVERVFDETDGFCPVGVRQLFFDQTEVHKDFLPRSGNDFQKFPVQCLELLGPFRNGFGIDVDHIGEILVSAVQIVLGRIASADGECGIAAHIGILERQIICNALHRVVGIGLHRQRICFYAAQGAGIVKGFHLINLRREYADVEFKFADTGVAALVGRSHLIGIVPAHGGKERPLRIFVCIDEDFAVILRAIQPYALFDLLGYGVLDLIGRKLIGRVQFPVCRRLTEPDIRDRIIDDRQRHSARLRIRPDMRRIHDRIAVCGQNVDFVVDGDHRLPRLLLRHLCRHGINLSVLIRDDRFQLKLRTVIDFDRLVLKVQERDIGCASGEHKRHDAQHRQPEREKFLFHCFPPLSFFLHFLLKPEIIHVEQPRFPRSTKFYRCGEAVRQCLTKRDLGLILSQGLFC